MKIRLVLVIALVPLCAGADIYKSVDSDGNVAFSDKPTPGAKKIIEQLTPTYPVPSLPRAEAAAQSPTPVIANYYTAIRILKPTPGETLRDATGSLTADLEIVPPLKVKEGHILVVSVDGNNLASHDNATQLTISNLAPGTHTLKAQIMDATGQVQFSSESVTFHMQRTSSASSANPPPAR
jgi:hypothetical protein